MAPNHGMPSKSLLKIMEQVLQVGLSDCPDNSNKQQQQPPFYSRGGSRILQGQVSNPSERGTGGRAPKIEHFPGILYNNNNNKQICIAP